MEKACQALPNKSQRAYFKNKFPEEKVIPGMPNRLNLFP